MSSQSDYVVGDSTNSNFKKVEKTLKPDSPFLKIKAKELLSSKGVVHILNVDSVADAFKKLIDNHILSVPILDRRTKKYTGFLDIVDILSHYIEIFGDDFTQQKEWTENKGDILKYVNAKNILATPAEKVANKSGRNLFYPIESDAPVRAVIDIIVRENVHRVPIVNRAGELKTIVTQSGLVGWLEKNMAKLGKFPEKSIKELNIGFKDNVFSIKEDRPAFEAFRLLKEKQVSGVAVLDEDERIIGNISVSDIKILGYKGNLIAPLLKSCKEFIVEVRSKDKSDHQIIPGPIAVTEKATLEEVFTKLVVTRVHRVYIVDDKVKLVGVISLGDLLSAVRDHLY